MKTKRILTLSIALLCSTISVMAQDNKVTLRILETSDVHGAFFPIDFFNSKPLSGSMARVSTYVNRLRQQYGENVILIDNGDILQGQPTCYFTNFIKTDEKNIAAEVINYLRYDAETFGNHDVEPGHAVYDKWIRDVECPMLGANIIDTKTNQPYVKPYIVLNRSGVKVAIIGLLTPAIPNWLNEELWKGLRFDEMVSSARYWVNYVKEHEQPDVICGLFHSGWDGGIATSHYDEDATKKIAETVDGFDIIFFGHDHTARNVTTDKGVLCLDPSCNALNVADVTVELTKRDGRWTITRKEGKLADISEEDIDQQFVQHFQSSIDNVKEYVNRRIGFFTKPLRSRDCFFGSAPFTDFILNLQLKITGADIAFNAPLSFNSEISEGDVYVRDMFKLYRYENKLYVMRMTGKEIRGHLEMSYDLWVNTMTSPDDHIMLLNDDSRSDMQRYGFKNLTFNFDSAAGIDYEVDVTKPAGQKVHILRMSNGEPFDETKWYKVALNSYRGNGGGELLTLGAGIPKDSLDSRIIYMSDLDQRYYLTQEIERMGTVTPKANNNWRFVPAAWAEPALNRDRKLIFGDK